MEAVTSTASTPSVFVGSDKENPKLGESVELLRDLAHVAEGSKVDNPAVFAARIAALMSRDLGAASA
jgi:HSP90 family molecular chaperone